MKSDRLSLTLEAVDAARFSNEVATLVRETHGVECKGPSLADKPAIARVARAAMAMSNRPGGGLVVVGVSENAGDLTFDGLTAAQLATWVPDHVADRLFGYADPPVRFEMSIVKHAGFEFVTLEVAEFDEVPVICKKDFPGVLQAGAIYVRPRRKPESVPVPTATDMRDLLELATEKRARRFLATAERVGLVPAGPAGQTADEEAFRAEARDLL